MPETSKLEKLNRELEKSEKKLRKAINDEKALQHQLKAAYPKGTDAPALYPWRYAGKFSARAGTPDR